MSTLDGKVALVSGAARGIGAAIAEALAHNGAKVVIGDLLDEDGQAQAEQIAPSATYIHLDVTNPDDWSAAVATAVERYGKLDVLVNNAGIAQAAPIEQYPRADWDKILAVNLTGAFNGIQAVVPAMKNAGGGSIISISSILGLMAVPASAGYVATKLVVFLASDDSSFSTGAEFVVDGGETAAETNGGSLSAILGPNGVLSSAG